MICLNKKCNTELRTGVLQGCPVWYCPECHAHTPRMPGGEIAPMIALPASPVNVGASSGMSEGEADFAYLWNKHFPQFPFVTEYTFHPTRHWKLDFYWPAYKIAVEFEGYGHGKDNRYNSDVDKYNSLAFRRIRLFRCTRSMLKEDRYKQFLDYVRAAIEDTDKE